jgi:hypothetical protein
VSPMTLTVNSVSAVATDLESPAMILTCFMIR